VAPSLDHKLLEVLEHCSDDARRFYLLVDSVTRGEASEEDMAYILGFEPDQFQEAQAEIANGVKAWNAVQRALTEAARKPPSP
jgi:hypothetical protein